MDDHIKNHKTHETASLGISMEVNGGIIGQMRRAKVEIPSHIRNGSIYYIIYRNCQALNQHKITHFLYIWPNLLRLSINILQCGRSQNNTQFLQQPQNSYYYKNHMDIEHRNSHYLHTIEHPHSQRSIIKSFHSFSQNTHHYQIAIANHSTIEIYRNVGTSIVYERTQHFMCDISVMEVIPVKGQNSDILFMADELGRFMFWSPAIGVLSSNNNIRAPESFAPFYQKAPAEEKQPQFSGVASSFNTLDTEATVFFTVSTKIIILKIRWSKGKIHYLHPPSEISCPYLDVNYIGIMAGKQALIGIVEQRQQKTFLRFHKANSQNFQCSMTLQKANLSSFYSSPEGQQIITVTNSQLSIYNTKAQQIICTFQISQSGFVCSIDYDLYLYIGQLGSQMIVFSKKHYKNYGSFMLQNQVCMKLSSHGKLADGGHLISVIDQGHTVQFIALYEQSWKSIRSIFATSSIFSIQDLQKPNQCLAVVRVGQNIHQVGILSKRTTSKLQKQTILKTPILALFSANNGRALIISTHDTNSVMVYDQKQQIFEQSFQFESGIIIAFLDKYVVMENRIYVMDLNKNIIKQLWAEKTGIVCADFDHSKFIGFQCTDNTYKFYNTQTNQIDRVRKNCTEQYLWRFYKKQVLLVASLDLPGKLKIVPLFKQTTIVQTQCTQIIVDIQSCEQLIVVSYSNCKVYVYEYVGGLMNVVYVMECASEPLQVVGCGGGRVLAYGNNQSYMMRVQQEQPRVVYEQLQFDPSKQNNQIVYLPTPDKYVVAHQQSLALYTLSHNKPEYSSNFRVVSMNVAANTSDTNPPFATIRNNIIYVVSCYEIIIRNVHTAQLLKKQSHGMKEISCIEKLDVGLLVCGIDDMDTAQAFVFDYKDLQILYNEGLNKKMPYAVKRKQGDTFFLREESAITLYQVKHQLGLKQIFSTKIGLNGYTLAVQPEINMIMASDPLRYLVAYDYRLNKLVSLCRYQNLNTINDAQFLECSAVLGDSVGNLSIAQFNFDKGEVFRTVMTEVGSIKVGSEIIQVRKGKQGVIYSTISGSVGRIRAISNQQFTILKQAQRQTLSNLESNKNQLKYQQWVDRASLTDKLIDGFLIDIYLANKKNEGNRYGEVQHIWQNLGLRR